MKQRDDVQLAFDDFMADAKFIKKAGSWYRRGEDMMTVTNLQRSRYGPLYFVNLALWLLPLGQEEYPKHHTCHAVTRLERLMPETEVRNVERLLNMESEVEGAEGRSALMQLLDTYLKPALSSVNDVRSLRTTPGRDLLDKCLVRATAQDLLFVSSRDAEET